MPLFDVARPLPAGYRELSVEDLPLPVGAEVTIIDVREPHEFSSELGHVPGATLVPLASVPAHAAAWDREQQYLLVCRSGGRSGQAAAALARMGFTRVINLAGGMLAWNQAGRSIEK